MQQVFGGITVSKYLVSQVLIWISVKWFKHRHKVEAEPEPCQCYLSSLLSFDSRSSYRKGEGVDEIPIAHLPRRYFPIIRARWQSITSTIVLCSCPKHDLHEAVSSLQWWKPSSSCSLNGPSDMLTEQIIDAFTPRLTSNSANDDTFLHLWENAHVIVLCLDMVSRAQSWAWWVIWRWSEEWIVDKFSFLMP